MGARSSRGAAADSIADLGLELSTFPSRAERRSGFDLAANHGERHGTPARRERARAYFAHLLLGLVEE
jgi:hypothetical protein